MAGSVLVDRGGGTWQVESGYLRDDYLAVYLIVEDGKVAIFDTAHPGSRSQVEAALAELDLSPEAVEYVFVSHLHLDHSGGAGHYARMLPNARFICHPKAAEHLADPIKIIEAAKDIYKESYDRLYGEVIGVPSERIETAADGTSFSLGGRSLQVLTPAGHSFHQFCLLDKSADCCHTADGFGHLPRLPGNAKSVMRVISAPSQFAPEKWHEAVEQIAGLKAARISIAHCGMLEAAELPERVAQVQEELATFVDFARNSANSADPLAEITRLMREHWLAKLWPGESNPPGESIDGDITLAALGLALWQKRHMNKA